MAFSLILSSCAPKTTTSITKKYPPLDYREEVLVFGLQDDTPEDAELLGIVKIGDSGFSTNCDYDVVLNEAKMEARKTGGNAIKIIEHKPPSFMGSSCHRITVNVLRIANPVDPETVKEKHEFGQ